jgi:hypothetical protein
MKKKTVEKLQRIAYSLIVLEEAKAHRAQEQRSRGRYLMLGF